LSTVFLVTLPISAPIPAPTAMPRNGTKNNMPNSPDVTSVKHLGQHWRH
jgi:hypothetical protein